MPAAGALRYRVDVDTGGTFTDGVLVTSDGRTLSAKVQTTPYDLSISTMQVMEELAEIEELTLRALLERTDSVRYATTQATNLLLERRGPKLGMITTRGFEDTMSLMRARGRVDGLSMFEKKHQTRAQRPEPLIPRELIRGIVERVDSLGNVVIPARREDIRRQVTHLIDDGVEGIVAGLLWANKNDVHERLIRDVLKEEFPGHYLGAIPVVLASEVTQAHRELPRFNTATINAYLHRSLAKYLYDLEDKLRQSGLRFPLLMMQNFGGVARTAKTHAIATWNSGPVAGLQGARFLARAYGFDNVICTDAGGTSFDIALILDDNFQVSLEPIIQRFRCRLPLVEVLSVGAGGGSIAWIDPTVGTLQVGPQSAGSVPGPAAYGLGGREPTLTDADVVLGVINPENFLGGRVRLDRERAEKAIERVAKPLGVSVVEAAAMIVRIADGNMRNLLYKEISLKGHDPKEFTVLAYGGMGPTHCLGYVSDLDVQRVIAPNLASVFSAFGASTTDVKHQYFTSQRVRVYDGLTDVYDAGEEVLAAFNSTVERIEEQAWRDLRSEGFESSENVVFDYQVEMKYGGMLFEVLLDSPVRRLGGMDDVRALCDAYETKFVREFGREAAYREGGIEIESIILTATGLVPTKPVLGTSANGTESYVPESQGERDVYHVDPGEWVATPIYRRESLRPGATIAGPAVVEATNTTLLVRPGWQLAVDGFENCVFTPNRGGDS